jgi:DNA-binding NarL/FixJ family response regulator
MIKILICDDQEIARQGLSMILGSVADLIVLGVASNGEEAVRLVESLRPDVVLMDLKMPVMNGAQATRIIRQRLPAVQVLVLTTYDDDEWLFDAIRAGASGYLLKDTPPADLLAAIRHVAQGKSPVDPTVAGRILQSVSQQHTVFDPAIADLLSTREIEFLRYMAQGLSNSAIGHKVSLSEGTVRNMISQLFSKLGVTDRTQAVVIAIRHGLITINEI